MALLGIGYVKCYPIALPVPSKESEMTLPDQRLTALRLAGEILRELRSRRDVLDDLRHQAQFILRHYSESQDLQKKSTNSIVCRESSWASTGLISKV